MSRNRNRDHDEGEVTIGSTHVTIRRPHERRRHIAGILHQEVDEAGHPTWLVLDRLVHQAHDAIAGWPVHGAITTEMGRPKGCPLDSLAVASA